jgi:hypothetical protein
MKLKNIVLTFAFLGLTGCSLKYLGRDYIISENGVKKIHANYSNSKKDNLGISKISDENENKYYVMKMCPNLSYLLVSTNKRILLEKKEVFETYSVMFGCDEVEKMYVNYDRNKNFLIELGKEY